MEAVAGRARVREGERRNLQFYSLEQLKKREREREREREKKKKKERKVKKEGGK